MNEAPNWALSLQVIAIVVTMVWLPPLIALGAWKWDQRRKKRRRDPDPQ